MRNAFAQVTKYDCRSLDDFFGTSKGLSDERKLECARRVRVTCRAVHLSRIAHYESLNELVLMEWSTMWTA